jgi:hypothetical protein
MSIFRVLLLEGTILRLSPPGLRFADSPIRRFAGSPVRRMEWFEDVFRLI